MNKYIDKDRSMVYTGIPLQDYICRRLGKQGKQGGKFDRPQLAMAQ